MNGRAHILVVDDDAEIRDVLSQQLKREGFRVTLASNYKEMQKSIQTEMPDLFLLDIMLPDADGFAVARELRGKSDVGIIMLTGKIDTIDKVVGLEIGADDYITKPFDNRELIARVNSTLRRTQHRRREEPGTEPSKISFADWTLDLVAYELVSPKGENVHLTHYEFLLLKTFTENVSRVLSRDKILDLLRGEDWAPFDRTVDVMVGKLRGKIEADPKKPALIKTVWGVGYKFTPDVKIVDQ